MRDVKYVFGFETQAHHWSDTYGHIAYGVKHF